MLLLFGQQAFQLKAFLAGLRLVPPDSSVMTTTRADSPKSLQMLPCWVVNLAKKLRDEKGGRGVYHTSFSQYTEQILIWKRGCQHSNASWRWQKIDYWVVSFDWLETWIKERFKFQTEPGGVLVQGCQVTWVTTWNKMCLENWKDISSNFVKKKCLGQILRKIWTCGFYRYWVSLPRS